jgi:hypothetical protein
LRDCLLDAHYGRRRERWGESAWTVDGELAEELSLVVPDGDAVDEVFARRDRARELLDGLRRFAISVALHALGDTVRDLSPTSPGEYADGYLSGRRTCELELSRHLGRPPAPSPDTVDVLARLCDHALEPPAVESFQDGFREVFERRYAGSTREELDPITKGIGAKAARFVAEALEEAFAELRAAHRDARELRDALAAPGDLLITEPGAASTLTTLLRSFAASVRTDAVPGRGYATGFYVASEHVARLCEKRATDLRFPRVRPRGR